MKSRIERQAGTEADKYLQPKLTTSASIEANPMLAAVVPYQLCPKCNGQGTVSKPPYIAGDVYEWSSSSCQFQCDVCNGQKIIPMFVLPQEIKTLESKKSYDLEIGDNITPVEVIKPMEKCLSKDKVYKIIRFRFNSRNVRVNFQIIDDNGNKKRYNLNTFHRRWRSV